MSGNGVLLSTQWDFIVHSGYLQPFNPPNLINKFNQPSRDNTMAILNKCPLTGIISRHDGIIDIETNYLNHILGLSISQLTKISNAANMPRMDNLTETKLLFCAYAKQAKLLVHNRQLLNLDNKVIITHFKLLQSLAIYLEKEPKFYNRIPKYTHY